MKRRGGPVVYKELKVPKSYATAAQKHMIRKVQRAGS
jgi:hypothetical protein